MNIEEILKRSRPEHRKEMNDMEWAASQAQGPPLYKKGDFVEFMEGGFAMITEVSKARGGWPVSYSTRAVRGMKEHPKTKCAWFYEGDIKRKIGHTETKVVMYEDI